MLFRSYLHEAIPYLNTNIQTTRLGDTIFHKNHHRYYRTIADAILKGFNVHLKNIEGDTVFHNDYHYNYLDFAIEHGFNPNTQNINGETLFHQQSYIYKEKLLMALDYGFNINSMDNNGNTIFHRFRNKHLLYDGIKRGFDYRLLDEKNTGRTMLHDIVLFEPEKLEYFLKLISKLN